MDIGQPKDYLSGQTLHLSSLTTVAPDSLAKGANIKGNVMIHESANVDPSAVIGPNVVIGEGCKVGPGARIVNSTMLAGSCVKAYSYMDGSILGWKSTIGQWCRVTKLAVIAEDV